MLGLRLMVKRGWMLTFDTKKEAKKYFFYSFSGAENEPRDIHLTRALPYMEGA
jgi:hypothetical protein